MLRRCRFFCPSPLCAAVLAFACTALCFAVWVWELEQRDLAQQRTQVSELANDHALALQRSIESALSANNVLVAMVRQGQGEVQNFEAIGEQLLPFYPGIIALGLAPNGIVQKVVPTLGNEAVLGFNQLADPVQGAEAILARDSGQLTLAGPLTLVQGGVGVVGRHPVYLDTELGKRRFWGFTTVTIRIADVLATAHLPTLAERGYRYRLMRTIPQTGQEQDISVSSPPPGPDPVVRSVSLPNGQWSLALTPNQGWGSTTRLAHRCLLGLMFSLLVGYLARLLLQLKAHERDLASLVQARTAEIFSTQQQLQATMDAIPDMLLELDDDGRFLQIDHAHAKALAAPAAQLIGHHLWDVLPHNTAQTLMAALQEAKQQGSSTGRQICLNIPEQGPSWFELSVARKAATSDSAPGYVLLARDITQQRAALERIEHLAHYDGLTGLPNRTLLAQRAAQSIAHQRDNHGDLAVLFLDLDHFKNVNDSLGHRLGDALLVALTQRLQTLMREQDTVSRFGGDEFLLLLPHTGAEAAGHMATQLLHHLAQPFQIEGHELSTTLSMGVAIFPKDGDNFDTLYQRADAAMYRAKRSGRNRYSFFTADLETASARALLLENALHRALERQQFALHYQVQVSLQTNQIVGAEALLRWQHPELGAISPAEFIPIAENSGMIVAIGEWVLSTAAHDAKRWLDQGIGLRTVSVNLSAVQFRHPQLLEMVSRCLADAQLPGDRLELELTEGTAVEDPTSALEVMTQLHQRGAQLSMDDFGTGYSSLSQLKRFPLGKLKIDQSFVRDVSEDANDRAIITAIIHMAQALGMRTTAEGVETEAQRAFLLAQGCNEGQGYLFSRPLPTAAFEALLRTPR
ncbi:MAG: EAL domain-containing protein [Burkholderiaceae bacterium]|nr:EAL domain-containing protein [Burkholderiaceae bacterium]